jgi:hypothetical protein
MFGFVIIIVCLVAFSALLVYGEDPFALGRTIIVGFAYLFAIALSISWLAVSGKPRRALFFLLVSIIAVLACVYAFSGGSGYPATNATSVTSYSCTTTSGINSAGINFSSYGCTGNNAPVQNAPLALGYNLIVWTPLVGCVLYSMPGWSEGSTRYYELARLLGGSVIAAAILLNVVGIGWSGSLQSLPSIHSPLNPYLATGECDSVTADFGCVYVNHVYVFADYAFWLGIAVLTSLGMSVFTSRRIGSRAPIGKGVLISLTLVFLLAVGLVVIPTAIARSGVLVNSGDSFSFDPLNSFIRVPFEVNHNDTLNGAFESTTLVDAYVMNSTQYTSFDQNGDYCPLSSIRPVSANATQGSVATNLGSGSYSLVFCAVPHDRSIEVTVTSPIKLSP